MHGSTVLKIHISLVYNFDIKLIDINVKSTFLSNCLNLSLYICMKNTLYVHENSGSKTKKHFRACTQGSLQPGNHINFTRLIGNITTRSKTILSNALIKFTDNTFDI